MNRRQKTEQVLTPGGEVKMKYLKFLVIALAVLAVLAACAPTQPAAVQPTAVPAAAGKWCSDVRIVFFPGGPAGGVFAVNVYNGAVQAQADLGPKVD
jgi:simple sugar transport system substrate-binding protein